jgi:hypothetical protein
MIVSVVVLSEKPKSGYMPHLQRTRKSQKQQGECQTIVSRTARKLKKENQETNMVPFPSSLKGQKGMETALNWMF